MTPDDQAKFIVDAQLPRDLCDLVKRQLPTIIAALGDHSLVELDRSTVHVP